MPPIHGTEKPLETISEPANIICELAPFLDDRQSHKFTSYSL